MLFNGFWDWLALGLIVIGVYTVALLLIILLGWLIGAFG